jgi:hypothetical protein
LPNTSSKEEDLVNKILSELEETEETREDPDIPNIPDVSSPVVEPPMPSPSPTTPHGIPHSIPPTTPHGIPHSIPHSIPPTIPHEDTTPPTTIYHDEKPKDSMIQRAISFINSDTFMYHVKLAIIVVILYMSIIMFSDKIMMVMSKIPLSINEEGNLTHAGKLFQAIVFGITVSVSNKILIG